MTDIVWHRCSMCGERWAGMHQCEPTQGNSTFKQTVGHQHSHAEVGAIISVAEAAHAKIDRLRAALREIAEKCTSSFCPVEDEIRAIVKRAVGGEL